MNKFICVLIIALQFSCKPTSNVEPKEYVTGYAPVYASQNIQQSFVLTAAKPTAIPGKIYAYGNYLFQTDISTGVHVINDSIKTNPQKVGFISIYGCSEIAIKDHFAYVNSLNDLIVLDISNAANPQFVKRIVNAFPQFSQNYPSATNTYFECVDKTKGIVVGWVLKDSIKGYCYR